MKKYPPLAAHPLKTNTSFARPAQQLPERVNLDDPAFSVMTDLNVVSMVNVRAKTSMDRANAKMIRYGVRMLLVLDDSDNVVGLVTATDILGEKPIRFLQHMGGTHADIMVRDVMTTQRELEAMLLPDVAQANPAVAETGMLNTDTNNFGPQLGLAWRAPVGVWRAAYGFHYGEIFPVTYSQVRFSPPGSTKWAIPAPDLIDPLRALKKMRPKRTGVGAWPTS